MEFALGVGTFPISAIVWVSIERFPNSPLGTIRDFLQVVRQWPFDSFADGIAVDLAVLSDPTAS